MTRLRSLTATLLLVATSCATALRPIADLSEIDARRIQALPQATRRTLARDLGEQLHRHRRLILTHVERATKASRSSPTWYALDLPVDASLLASARPEQELSVRFLIRAFAGQGFILSRDHAQRLLPAWKVRPSDEEIRRLLGEARGRGTIRYRGQLQVALQSYSALLQDDARRLEEALDRLSREHYAEDAILSFYIAHANALVGLARGILDVPLAPINVPLHLLGKEAVPGLGALLPAPIPYVGEYGQKYGKALETGAFLGLLGAAPGTLVGSALGRTVGSGTAWVGERAGRFGPIVVTFLRRWLRAGGAAYVIKAQTDIVRAVRALWIGSWEQPDGTILPLTEEDFSDLLLETVANFTVAKNVKDLVKVEAEEPYRPGRSRLREFDIDEYGTFKNRRGDGLQGHEMLQNAWLEHHGYASRRLRGVASRKNPAVALSKKLHEEIYEEQRKLGLLDKHRLKRMSAEENIELNAEAMRRVGKIPEQVIQALRRKALEHASRLSP